MKTKKQSEKREFHQLTQFRRDRLEIMWRSGQTQKDIGLVIGIDQSNVSREIQRNRRKIRCRDGTKDGPYEAAVAQQKAYVRRKYAKYQGKKINENDDLKNYIIQGLRSYWGPDEISGRMKEEKQPFYASKTAIYEWLYSVWGQRYCAYLYSKKHHPRKNRKKKTKRIMIPDRKGLELRPEGANNRTQYGHWENDTIVSGKKTRSKAALSVTNERKAKYTDLRKIKNLKPATNNKAIKDMFEDKLVLTATFDNGIENTKHKELGIDTYFCDRYASYQKGGVENTNKMIRRFIPKGSDISKYSDDYVKMVADTLNNKPRKSLGYKKPIEVMIENNLFTTKNAPLGVNINNFIREENYAFRG